MPILYTCPLNFHSYSFAPQVLQCSATSSGCNFTAKVGKVSGYVSLGVCGKIRITFPLRHARTLSRTSSHTLSRTSSSWTWCETRCETKVVPFSHALTSSPQKFHPRIILAAQVPLLAINSSPTGFILVEINVEGKGLTLLSSTSFTTGVNPAGSHPKKFLLCIIRACSEPGLAYNFTAL